MINIAIVEDETAEAERLAGYLRRYEKETDGIEFHIVRFSDGIAFLTDYKAEHDIIFMDIEMPGLDGMATAQKLRLQDPEAILVFVTNMAQFAVKGYEVDAMDFMVKPVSYYDFAMKFEHVLKHIDFDGDVKIKLMNKGEVKYLSARDVRYVEVIRHSLIFHTGVGGGYETRGTLKKLEEELTPAAGFVRCNNYCLVNLRYVTGITGYELYISSGVAANERETLMISHPRKKGFVTALNEYLREHA